MTLYVFDSDGDKVVQFVGKVSGFDPCMIRPFNYISYFTAAAH